MTVSRIWFNKSFSSIYNVIQLLKRPDAPGTFHVICSHSNSEFVGFDACDEAVLEPGGLVGEEYVQYCLDFCRARKVDLFSPGKEKEVICDARDRFEAAGVKMLIAGDPETLRHFEMKGDFYTNLSPEVAHAPRFIKVNTAAEFTAAVETLRAEGHRVCFKPAVSTGGLGFRILNDNRSELRSMFGGDAVQISSKLAVHILEQEPTFRDLLVMEYLDGAEYSIDCIAQNGRLISSIARRKPTRSGGAQLLEDNPELHALADRLTTAYKLDSIFNIQVRYRGEVPKLLEINARMSGGVYFACLSGVNLPAWAAALALGIADEKDIPPARSGVMVQQQYREFIYECALEEPTA